MDANRSAGGCRADGEAHAIALCRHLHCLRSHATREVGGDLRPGQQGRSLRDPRTGPGRAGSGRYRGRDAGASARREFERRETKREECIRAKPPRLGGLILAVTDDQQSTKAWDTGALGEERLGARLNELASDTLRVLHDRRIPRTRANIDHLAVPTVGVYVVDAKRYQGRPHLKGEGGFLRSRVEKLLVGSRDCTKLVDGVFKQVDIVRNVLDDDIRVHGILCFVEADWPLIGGAFTTREVQVLWPKKLYPILLQAPGPLQAESIAKYTGPWPVPCPSPDMPRF